MFAMALALEARAPYAGFRCQRVAVISRALGERMALPHEDQVALQFGSYLRNIGNISVPEGILYKRGLLTDEEWALMRSHTLFGESLCRPVQSFAHILPIIRSHHERWDGTGYPDGLVGEAIPLLARIVQAAEIYDALTTARPYKPPFSHSHAIEIFREESERGWRDPKLTDPLADLPIADLEFEAKTLPDVLAEVQPSAHLLHRPVEFYSCFVSHSSHDAAIAKRINDDLRKNGVNSWYAPEDLKIGDRFRLQIDESIKLHDKLLLILSGSSVRSTWVESEVEAALEHERHRLLDIPENEGRSRTILFPICIDDAVFEASSGWAAEVRRTRHIGDFRNWLEPNRYDAALKRLLRDLAASDKVKGKSGNRADG